MQTHGAGYGAHRARSHAEPANGLDGRLAQLGMRGQAQVVVGSEVDDQLAIEARFGRAFRFEDAQALVGAFGAPLLDLFVKERECVRHLPQSSAGRIPLLPQPPVPAGVMHQRRAFPHVSVHHFADENIVVSGRDAPLEGAFHDG